MTKKKPLSKTLNALIEEKLKRDIEAIVPPILEQAFPEQLSFITDTARRKAAIVARRSGKSYMIGIYLLWTALTFRSTKCLYFGKTQYSAKNTMWLHIIFPLIEKYNIPYKLNKSLQEVTFNNGSILKLTGADATDTQIEKALGGKYKLVIFDECQVITHDLERWIKDRLGPAMIDEQGTICCLGTAGDYMGEHFWYKITKPENQGQREPGWIVYQWPWDKNPYMKDLITKEVAEMKSYDANIDKDPGFRREYLCEWVIESDARIYKFDPAKNIVNDPDLIKGLMGQDPKWKFIIGLDFGYEDSNAIVVGAFSKYDPNCYIVDSYKQNHMNLNEIADLLNHWKQLYKPTFMIGDAQDKIVIQTLREIHRLPILAANKLGKFAHTVAMNSDFRMGKIKVIVANNRPLIKEWDELVWAEKQRIAGVYKENPTKENHLADAALYLHHFSKHYRAETEPEVDPHPMRTAAENRLKRKLDGIVDQVEGGITIYDILGGIGF